MSQFKANLVTPKSASPRCSIGGDAILPEGAVVPPCRNCGSPLLLFLQFDIDPQWQLPFKPQSHLVVFMCPNCNDIPTFTDFRDGKLPPKFWETTEGHFFVALYQPTGKVVPLPQQPFLSPSELQFAEVTVEDGSSSITVGEPAQGRRRRFQCGCGAEMGLIVQITENFGFPKQPEAPSQPNSFSADEYCLFLGTETSILGCPKQCDPRSVWVNVQG